MKKRLEGQCNSIKPSMTAALILGLMYIFGVGNLVLKDIVYKGNRSWGIGNLIRVRS